MDFQTISDVSREYGVSTRMLRYYEQSGLFSSQKKEGYAYRVYDESAIKRLQQVITLRKLQIPVKQIAVILNNADAVTVIDIFNERMQQMDSEIIALSTIRGILSGFISELESVASVNLNLGFLNGTSVLEIVDSLTLTQRNTKEKNNVEKLNRAAEVLSKMNNVKVRMYLYYNGNCSEAIALYEKAFGVKAEFILWYKDVPPEEGAVRPQGTENYVMNTWLKLDNDEIGTIGMCDRLPDPKYEFGNGMSLHVSLGSADAVCTAFDILKEDGTVIVAPGTVFFSECYCEVRDKFGVSWILMYN